MEPGEELVEAARRETLEETGVPVEIEGVLRIEHSPFGDGSARLRVVFVARPVDDTPPRTTPNDDTLGARWVSLEEMDSLPLRGTEVKQIFEYVDAGAPIFPLGLITREGDPFPTPQSKAP